MGENCRLSATETKFDNNIASMSGMVLYAANNSILAFNSSNFINNTIHASYRYKIPVGYRAALSCADDIIKSENNVSITIENSKFIDNLLVEFGTFYFDCDSEDRYIVRLQCNGTVKMRKTLFSHNCGGLIGENFTSISLEECQVESMAFIGSEESCGYAVSIGDHGTISVAKSNISHTLSVFAAGVFTRVHMQDCHFKDVYSFYFESDGNFTIKNSTFSESGIVGPLVTTGDRSTVTVDNCLFHNNAGQLLKSSSNITIKDSTFQLHSIGLLYDCLADAEHATIHNCTFENNIGCLIGSYSSGVIQESLFLHNDAGEVDLFTGDNMTVLSCTFYNNTCYMELSLIIQSNFTQNILRLDCDGIRALTIIDSVFVNNTFVKNYYADCDLSVVDSKFIQNTGYALGTFSGNKAEIQSSVFVQNNLSKAVLSGDLDVVTVKSSTFIGNNNTVFSVTNADVHIEDCHISTGEANDSSDVSCSTVCSTHNDTSTFQKSDQSDGLIKSSIL